MDTSYTAHERFAILSLMDKLTAALWGGTWKDFDARVEEIHAVIQAKNERMRLSGVDKMEYLKLSELIDGYVALHPEIDRTEATKHVLSIIAGALGAVKTETIDNGNGTHTHVYKFTDPRQAHTVDNRQAKPL